MGKFLGDIASDVYGVNTNSGQVQPLFPRSKFQFMAIWNIGGSNGAVFSVPFTRIQSCSMPGYSVKAALQNQYNKKRIIQTGVDYSPIQMRVYDDRQAQVENFIRSYSGYYYAGLFSNSEKKFSDDIVDENFAGGGNNSNTGFILRDNRYYFKNLTIIRLNSSTDANRIVLRNPVISSVEGDTLDYSDSGAVTYTFQILYEAFHVETNISADDARAQVAEALESPGSKTPY